MKPDGTSKRRLVRGREPAWSPDGTQIAFLDFNSNNPSSANIFVMRADGSHVEKLTRDKFGHSLSPTWSPDGRRLAFERAWAKGGEDLTSI